MGLVPSARPKNAAMSGINLLHALAGMLRAVPTVNGVVSHLVAQIHYSVEVKFYTSMN